MTNPNDKRPSDDPDSDKMHADQRPNRSPDENYEGEGKPGSGSRQAPGSGRPDEDEDEFEDRDDLSDGSEAEEL